METFSALLAICTVNSPVTDEFPAQRPVSRSFDVFFDLCLNKRLSKQSWGWWFETPLCPLWRHSNNWARWSGMRSRYPHRVTHLRQQQPPSDIILRFSVLWCSRHGECYTRMRFISQERNHKMCPFTVITDHWRHLPCRIFFCCTCKSVT